MVYAKKKRKYEKYYPDIYPGCRYEVHEIGSRKFSFVGNKRKYDVSYFLFYIDGERKNLEEVKKYMDGECL